MGLLILSPLLKKSRNSIHYPRIRGEFPTGDFTSCFIQPLLPFIFPFNTSLHLTLETIHGVQTVNGGSPDTRAKYLFSDQFCPLFERFGSGRFENLGIVTINFYFNIALNFNFFYECRSVPEDLFLMLFQ